MSHLHTLETKARLSLKMKAQWAGPESRKKLLTARHPCALTLEDILLNNSELVTESGCRIWLRKPINSGYGTVKFQQICQLVHRAAWGLARGPIPDGLQVCHHCDVKLCINVDHLFLGTQKDNLRDARNKGRIKSLTGFKHGPEFREKARLRQLGKQPSLGFKHTAETNEKNRQHMLGNQHLLGYHHTDAAKAKNSAASKKMWASPEYRAKVMAARAGYRHSVETKAKMSAANRRRTTKAQQ